MEKITVSPYLARPDDDILLVEQQLNNFHNIETGVWPSQLPPKRMSCELTFIVTI
jgi:hypothetical protein